MKTLIWRLFMIARPLSTIISICWRDPQHQVNMHRLFSWWKYNCNTQNNDTLKHLFSWSFQVKSHHHLNSPCYPCLPHRCHLFPKRAPLCRPNMAANMATTIITTTMSTRRKRRSTSTNTSTSANTKARTRRRIETGTTPMSTATARLVADPCAHHLCLTRTAISVWLSGYIHQSAPGWRLESKTCLLDLIIHYSSVLSYRKINLDKRWK